VVFVYYKGFAFPLITTDLTLTAEQMIEFYSARRKISGELAGESIFQGRCPEGLIPAVKFVCSSIFRGAA
jgi:hypothetical protein